MAGRPSVVNGAPTPRWRRPAARAVAIHAAAVALPFLAILFTDSPVVILLVGGGSIFLAFLFLAAMEASRSALVVTPLSFYFLWYAVSLGLSPIHMARRLGTGDTIDFSTANIPPEYVCAGYLTFLLGSLALHAGIQFARPGPANESAARTAFSGTAVSVLLSIWACSIVVRLGWNALSFLGGFRGLFASGSLAALTLFALRGREPDARTPRFYLVLFVGIAIEFLMNVNSGSKAFIMYSFIPVLWLIVAAPRLRPLMIPLVVVLTPFYLFVVAPVVGTSRIQNRSSTESHVVQMAEVVQQGEFVEGGDHLARFLDRQFDPIPVGFIHADVERFGFRNGETLEYVAYAFIPRALWPEKPNVSRGAWFTAYLGAASSEATATSSTGITAVGELYWNFGTIGVLLGMFVIGLLIGAQWRLAGRRPDAHPVRFLLYVALIITMPDMAEAGTTILAALYRILVVAVLLTVSTTALRLAEQRNSRVPV